MHIQRSHGPLSERPVRHVIRREAATRAELLAGGWTETTCTSSPGRSWCTSTSSTGRAPSGPCIARVSACHSARVRTCRAADRAADESLSRFVLTDDFDVHCRYRGPGA
jgi:hypothetical protein